MNIKINQAGCLEIQRGGDYKRQLCPLNKGITFCCDDCPLFGEPSEEPIKEPISVITLCHRTLFGVIIDERKAKEVMTT